MLFIDLTDDRPADVSKRAFSKASRHGMAEVGRLFDEELKPRHFQSGADVRYGYAPRSAKYLARKKQIARHSFRVKDGGEVDWVYSGVTRTAVMRPHVVRAFPTRATVRLNTPSYVTDRPRSGRPSGEELVRTAKDEEVQIERTYQATVDQDLQQVTSRRTTRFRR